MKKTWEGINKLLHCKAKSSKALSNIRDPSSCDKLTRNTLLISNNLNTHFASVGNRLAKKLPQARNNFFNFLAKWKSPGSLFSFQTISAAEVKLQIFAIPNNKDNGLYSCPTQLLKCVSIEKNELLYKGQYGFCKSHSTQHATLDIINSIQTNLDKGLRHRRS